MAHIFLITHKKLYGQKKFSIEVISLIMWLYVTQHQIMRLFAVKVILSYEEKCKVHKLKLINK